MSNTKSNTKSKPKSKTSKLSKKLQKHVISSFCSLAHVIWLIDHTALTFEQIATLGDLHVLEVQSIADGEKGKGTRGSNPTAAGLLPREEIIRGESDSQYHLRITEKVISLPQKRGRYTPLSKREKKPDVVAWLLKNVPNISDPQIVQLVGTTKTTISAIREKTHWKIPDLKISDPVQHGFCSQKDLEEVIEKIAEKTAEKEALKLKESSKLKKRQSR